MYFRLMIFSLALMTSFCKQKEVKVYPVYQEKNGLVSIEAEHFTGAVGSWEEVEGRNAVTETDAGLGSETNQQQIIFNPDQQIVKLEGSSISISEEPVTLNWGFPNENAVKIAALEGEARKIAVFAYPENAEMPDLKAPGPRVGLFNGYGSLTESGRKIFSQVIDWAADKSKGNQLLMVCGSNEPAGFDLSTIELFRQMGYQVNIADDEEVKTGDAEGKSLIYISETVSSGPVGTKFRDVETPVVVCEPYVFDDMGMIQQKPTWSWSHGQSGNAMLNRNNKETEFSSYSIHFSQPGNYNLWMLGQNSGSTSPATVKVFLNQEARPESTEGGQVFQLRTALDWYQEGAFQVEETGWYNLHIVNSPANVSSNSKYPSWRLDKIVLTTASETITGDGPSPTIQQDTMMLAAKLKPPQLYLPPQVFEETNGYVIAEAEEIDHHKYWELRTDPAGFTGNGFLEWQGPNRTVSIEGLGGNHDSLFVRQGPQNEWLILRVKINNPGTYLVNARNIHQREDGDNDAWVNLVNFRPHQDRKEAVSRMGDSHQDGKGFSWLDWGVREFELKPGINNIFIGGRSIGFGIDRLAVYRKNDPEAEKAALNVENEPSPQVQ